MADWMEMVWKFGKMHSYFVLDKGFFDKSIFNKRIFEKDPWFLGKKKTKDPFPAEFMSLFPVLELKDSTNLMELAWKVGKMHSDVIFEKDQLLGENKKRDPFPTEFKRSLCPVLQFKDTNWTSEPIVTDNVFKFKNLRMDLTMGTEQKSLCLEYNDEKHTDLYHQFTYHFNNNALELSTKYQNAGILIGGFLMLDPIPSLGASIVYNHHCFNCFTKMKPRGISVGGGIRCNKDTKINVKGKHTNNEDTIVTKIEVERQVDEEMRWYSINTQGTFKTKMGWTTPNEACKIKFEFNPFKGGVKIGVKCTN